MRPFAFLREYQRTLTRLDTDATCVGVSRPLKRSQKEIVSDGGKSYKMPLQKQSKSRLVLEPPTGIEPVAPSLPWRCSTPELRRRMLYL